MQVYQPIIATNRTQSMGDIIIPLQTRDLVWLQVDAECSSTPTSGSVLVMFNTPTMDKPKALLDSDGNQVVIDLKNPYPAFLSELSIDVLVLRPINFDSDKTFNIAVTFKGA